MTRSNMQFTNNAAVVVAAIGTYTNIVIETNNGACESNAL